jgi:nucleoside-diphosphate-sugar epimerase
MKVLVTGHQGYIGVVMVPRLLELGYEVVGLDSGLYLGCDFGAAPIEIPTIPVDVRDVEENHFEGIDAVIHLAALSNDPLGDLNRQMTYDINHLASVRVARMAKQAGVERFLFSSSCSLYGAAGDDALDENAGFNPQTPYGESKILTEKDLSTLADDDFSPTYLRNATVYGLSSRLRADLVVNNLVGYAFTTGEVLMKSDGSPWRPLVHVEDLCRAFEAVLTAPREIIHDQAFNVGRTTENYRIREVAEIVRSVVPSCRLSFAEGASPDSRNYRVNFEKIEKTLPGYVPQWTVPDGARQLYEAYRDMALTEEQFMSDSFYRIKTIIARRNAGSLDANLRPTNTLA